MRRHGKAPGSSEESLMSQNWSDTIKENYYQVLEEIMRLCVCLNPVWIEALNQCCLEGTGKTMTLNKLVPLSSVPFLLPIVLSLPCVRAHVS